MLKMTKCFAETTDQRVISNIIDDTMQHLRVSGSVLLRETYKSPWAINIPNASTMSKLLNINSDEQVVAFHLVEFGHCLISSEQGDNILLKAGEILICFGGRAHRLSQGTAVAGEDISTLLQGGPNIQKPHQATDVESAALLCGMFLLQHTAFNPLFNALPPLVHITLSKQGELHNLSGVARIMADEIDRNAMGSGYIVKRLLEVLCAEVVRAHIESASHQKGNWLQAIKDPVVSRAIAAIHAAPGDNWSVLRLANAVAMSPSRFAARFSESVGDSPMSYLAKWRMNLASQKLKESNQSIDLIAYNVGYESPAAFSRAFKKHLGFSPASWRIQKAS